jgi:hypothetical protein
MSTVCLKVLSTKGGLEYLDLQFALRQRNHMIVLPLARLHEEQCAKSAIAVSFLLSISSYLAAFTSSDHTA